MSYNVYNIHSAVKVQFYNSSIKIFFTEPPLFRIDDFLIIFLSCCHEYALYGRAFFVILFQRRSPKSSSVVVTTSNFPSHPCQIICHLLIRNDIVSVHVLPIAVYQFSFYAHSFHNRFFITKFNDFMHLTFILYSRIILQAGVVYDSASIAL